MTAMQRVMVVLSMAVASCVAGDGRVPALTEEPGENGRWRGDEEPGDGDAGEEEPVYPTRDPSAPGEEDEREEGADPAEPDLLDDASGPVFTLEAVRDTWLKASTEQADALDPSERCAVAEGELLVLAKAAQGDDDGVHFLVLLLEPLAGCDLPEGYVYGEHFRVAEAPRPSEAAAIAVTAAINTWFKIDTAQSTELGPGERCTVMAGESLELASQPTIVEGDHWRVTLARPRSGCAFAEGYVYAPHFEQKVAVVYTATADTYLKSSTAQAVTLPDEQRCLIAAREVLELASEPVAAASDHSRVILSRPRSGCSLREGYVYAPHFQRNLPPPPAGGENPLDAPYYYQYANANEPGATCGITSGAMLLGFFGSTLRPDDLYRTYGKSLGQSPGGLASIYRAELGFGESTYTGTRAQIRSHIDEGRPVVIHGNFTGSGHVMLIVGYDAAGWIVHDPAGRWAGCYRCGYPDRTSTNGRFAHYDYASMSAAVMGADGDIWMSVGSTSAFTL